MARILVAEDDPDVRRLVAIALMAEGHEVSSAEDGLQAMQALSESSPDLLVLDVMMPNMDGYDVLEQMAEQGIRGQVRVMMLTARSSERDWARGFEMGCDAYMTKPFDIEELLSKVGEMISMPIEQLRRTREDELHKAHLLSQLESALEKGRK